MPFGVSLAHLTARGYRSGCVAATLFPRMRLLERQIRRYEHLRWARDNNRRVLPFAWGLEHICGRAEEPDPRAWLAAWAERTVAESDQWYATQAAPDYRLEGDWLTFTSAVPSPWPENNRVYARFFPARKAGPAVLVLPHWNAKPDAYLAVCRWLNALGITALRLSLPYHDARAVPGHDRADHLVGPNLGLTLQANRQAVLDARRCLRWLEQMGYNRLGLLGTSIGSSIGFITMAHDPAVRAGAFLHVSTYFGDVVRTGLTTAHVWESLRTRVTAEELRHFWSPISPFPYLGRVRCRRPRILVISGRYDATFLPEFSAELLTAMRQQGIEFEAFLMPVGHYTLELPPFSYAAGLRFGTFLFRHLA